MPYAITILLVSLLGQAPAEMLDAARELAPLLRGIERRLPSQVTVRPDALPPSPFSGQRATLFAFRVGKERPALDEGTERAIRDLLAWQAAPARHPNSAPLAGLWMEHLLMLVEDATYDPAGAAPDCELACAVASLLDPGEAFGETRRERLEIRDLILLEALAAAVADLPPAR
jgi:hypothetical protein